MKALAVVLSLFVFVSAYSPAELENLSTLIHLAQHHAASVQSHDESHRHEHNSRQVHSHSKPSHGGLISVLHNHNSQDSDEKSDMPHEHHFNLFSGFTAVLIEANPFETAPFVLHKPLLLEPSQLISNPHKRRLFRPPIS